jgi:hypothetical protein
MNNLEVDEDNINSNNASKNDYIRLSKQPLDSNIDSFLSRFTETQVLKHI